MAMKVTDSWIIYSCLIFGSNILCDRKLEKQHAVSSGSEAIDDMFYCLNGLRLEWSLACNGNKDCSDGSDETNELCARYEYGRIMSTDCGRVSKEIKNEHSLEATPWIVDIYAIHKSNISQHLGLGSIISPNVVVTMARIFRSSGIRFSQNSKGEYDGHLCKIDIPLQNDNANDHNYIDAKFIYLYDGANYEDLAVIVLGNKISFSNGVTPVCIDWYRRYNARLMKYSGNIAYGKISGFKIRNQINHIVLGQFFPEIFTDFRTCETRINPFDFESCIWLKLGEREVDGVDFQSLSVLHSDLYFLTGVGSFNNRLDKNKLGFKAITYQVPWIRGILFKHSTANSCVLPTVEGVVHSYEGSHLILSPGTLINPNTTVIENCEVGYHKAYPNGFRVCRRYGIWKTDSDKLCLKMCPPLLSDSLDIKCSYNGNYTDCSNLSIPNTIAIPSCKPTHYFSSNGHEEVAKELHCQSNGMWDKELYRCDIMSNACVLPTIEGVVFTHEDSNDILSQGTLVNHGVTVNENCTFGYHNVNPNSFRVCQKNRKWKTVYDKLCLKMCPPLLSDSLDIKCTYNGKNANCSNLSIPDTIAILKCKATYVIPNGHKETPQELHCQSNGLWDKELYSCSIISNACVLPTVEGVVFTYEDSNDILSHGTLINHGVTVNENCIFGYHNVYPNSFRVCQKNGKWKTAYDKLCFKMCPPLLSDSLNIKCSYNGKDANCLNRSIPDTIATPKCKPNYALPNGQIETPLELHCQSNGMWNNKLYICDPVCGKPFIKPQILIHNGETANVGTAPWNVAIYKKKSDYEFICGGSIISRNLVVSAAHCFWKKGMSYLENLDGFYKIAAGKYYKNFKIYENEYPQIMNVDRILLQDGYYGVLGHYAVDIAVVVLENSVSFSNGITPVCMDWDGIYNVSNGDEGKMVGWGLTEKGIESPILLKTNLPYINMTTCREMYELGFESYVTPDKCCAGFSLVPGYGVDEGDSGAGLCFLHSKLYYLTGVVSLKDPNANNSIALFTSVNFHMRWIRGLYLEYQKVQYN